MIQRGSFVAALSFALILIAQLAWTQAVPVPAPGAPAPGPSFSAPPRETSPRVEDLTRDMKHEEGLFTLYYNDPTDRSKDTERLLALIPARILNQDILFATSLSSGPYTGWMWDDYLIRLEVRAKQLAIVLPELRYSFRRESPVAEVVERTYNSVILATAQILAQGGGGDVLIDLGPLLKSNLAGLPGGGVRSDLSRWVKRKAYPKNVNIEVELAVGAFQGARLMGVAYTFLQLPPLGNYQARQADDRVGYFLTARRDWTKRHDERDTFERYVNRWNLQKKDPSLDLSPPVAPIIFYVEKTVPVQWRRWVREGIEVWNKAFEKIGFTGAIEVRQQTNDNEFKDLDPEDARYNFFRWIVSGSPFAMGPSRADPRTGEIMDSDIIFDDSMVRAWIDDFSTFTPRAIREAKGPGFREHLKRHPEMRIPGVHDPEGEDEAGARTEDLRRTLQAKLTARGQVFCDFSLGLQHQIALGFYSLALRTPAAKVPERLIGEAIRETVAHEVGHALGLRHNFKASSWLSMEEIGRRRGTGEPLTASVMDYNPILILPGNTIETPGHFVTPTIGPYDYWAIEYGYRTRGPADRGEDEMLAAIASRGAEPGLAYATDEDTMGIFSPDPLVNRFDMGSDPFRWATERVALADRLLAQVMETATSAGDSRYHLTRAFDVLIIEKGIALNTVARWIGGQEFHRDHQGDPGARSPFVLVPVARQREALDLLKKTLFREDFFSFKPELLNLLAPPRWSHWGVSRSLRLDYPIHDRIRILQWWTLVDILSPMVLQRIYDAEMKSSDADKFTVAELLKSLGDHIWAPLASTPASDGYSDSKPCISSIARGFQREHMEIIVQSVLAPADGEVSPDLHAMVCGSARDLLAEIEKYQAMHAAKLDRASRAHLQECRSRLERALGAVYQRRG